MNSARIVVLNCMKYRKITVMKWTKMKQQKSIDFKAIRFQSKEDAQNAPTPITTYALFLDGNYITNEQMNDKRFLKLLEG